jgi:hypothetical protein
MTIYTRTLSWFARTGQFNDGSAPSHRTYTLYYMTFNKRQHNNYYQLSAHASPRSTPCALFNLFSVNLGKIPKDRVGSMRRPVARKVAAGAAARATDHFRPTPNRRPTGRREEASYSLYILKFILW